MHINFQRLDHIQICIPKGQEPLARTFYLGILGLTEIEKPAYMRKNGGFWLLIGDIQLHIGTEDQIHPSKRHPAFEIEQFKQVKTYLLEQQVRIREDRPIPGFQRFSIFDPFDNRIELLGQI
ncbi:MAG: VOC family protein [Bacteroidota bacterium]